MWVPTTDGDAIVDLSAMETICIAKQHTGGYAINAASCTGDFYEIARFKTKGQADEALGQIMDQLNEEGC